MEIYTIGFTKKTAEEFFNRDIDLSVTDIRFYNPGDFTPKHDLVTQAAGHIAEGENIIISMGLARAYQVPGDTARRHWLQVNNIHFQYHAL